MPGQEATIKVVRVGLVQVLERIRNRMDQWTLLCIPESLAVDNPSILVGSETCVKTVGVALNSQHQCKRHTSKIKALNS